MSHIDIDNPEFTAAIRGYDKVQVDDYIERLQSFASEAEERARAAESELEFSRHTTVGPRVTEILELAVAEAKELRDRAGRECDDVRAEARRTAEEIRERSEREANEAREEIAAERRRAELAITQLEETKQALLGDLRQIHETLAQAAGIARPAPGLEAPEEPGVETDVEPPLEEDIAETVERDAVSLAPPLPERDVA